LIESDRARVDRGRSTRQSPGGRRGGRRTVDKAVDEAAAERSTGGRRDALFCGDAHTVIVVV